MVKMLTSTLRDCDFEPDQTHMYTNVDVYIQNICICNFFETWLQRWVTTLGYEMAHGFPKKCFWDWIP
jgi:hypothetical protein